MKKWLLPCALILTLIGCKPARNEKQLSIAAASSLQYVMEDLVAAFSAKTGLEVQLTTGSSGRLAQEILDGAHVDMFFSADMEFPEHLKAAGLVDMDAIGHFGDGRLVLWSAENHDLSLGLNALLNPDFGRIAIADPENSPYGRAARSALQKAGIWYDVQPRLVFAEDVGQVNRWIGQCIADVGFTSFSSTKAGPLAGKGSFIHVADSLAPALPHGKVVIDHAEVSLGRTKMFDEFLGSEMATTIREKHGY